MGKTIANTALQHLSGGIDRWVYRRRNGHIIIGKRPDMSRVVPTPEQVLVRQRFTRAAGYAQGVMADPARSEPYRRATAGTLSNARAAAMGDFLKPPTVTEVDITGYDGRVGDRVKVIAIDDFGVAGVTVSIRTQNGAVLEQGAAALVDGAWIYRATQVAPRDQPLTIEAEASDRAGNQRTLSEGWQA